MAFSRARIPLCLTGLCLLLAFTIAGCGDNSSEATAESFELPLEDKPEIPVPARFPPEKLVINELQEGTGQRAQKGDRVKIQYYGIEWRGFENANSWNYSRIPEFTLGEHRLLRGLNRALIGMREGGGAEVQIPYNYIHYPGDEHQKLVPLDALLYKVYLVTVVEKAGR
jgi:FKBP-type peptidyl-prolyl cis-trans isomerase